MQFLVDAGILLASYIFGSIPFGLLIVKMLSGKDIRTVASGRTGGTNAMRAAGPWAGFLTAALDIFKSASMVWLAQAVTSNVWIHILAPIAVILGHNYSIFLIERNSEGRWYMRGGAGGAAAGGGAFGLWPPIAVILIPIAFLVWYGIGYASVTTLSIGFISIVVFGVRAVLGLGPWEYVVYGLLAEALLAWALRPNIRRLKNGRERRHGLPFQLRQRKLIRARTERRNKKRAEDLDGGDRTAKRLVAEPHK